LRALFLTLPLLVGCVQEPPAPPVPGAYVATGEQLVVVNGEAVTQEMVDAVLDRIPREAAEQMRANDQLDQIVDNLVTGQVLYQQAIGRGLHEEPEVQMLLALASREVLASELAERVSEEAVTDEKVAELYEERRVQYARPAVHARHIVVAEEQLAQEILGQLGEGADFAALAAEHSLDRGTSQKGGDVGWFERRRMVKEFSDAAFAADKGALVGPVKTRLGYHVIEVLDKRTSTPVEEARPELEQILRKQALESYIEEARQGATITSAAASPEPALGGLDELTPPSPDGEAEGAEPTPDEP